VGKTTLKTESLTILLYSPYWRKWGAPHFRHSRALNLYRKCVPLPLISEWLGHSNLETTLIYAYADTEMKRAAIEKATNANHPIRNTSGLDGVTLDDDTLKMLYGLR